MLKRERVQSQRTVRSLEVLNRLARKRELEGINRQVSLLAHRKFRKSRVGRTIGRGYRSDANKTELRDQEGNSSPVNNNGSGDNDRGGSTGSGVGGSGGSNVAGIVPPLTFIDYEYFDQEVVDDDDDRFNEQVISGLRYQDSRGVQFVLPTPYIQRS